MIITTTESVPGREVDQILGIARGNVVRARFVGRDLIAGLRSIVGGEISEYTNVGGEISEYTKLMAESREQGFDRMKQHAAELGADAILNVRFTTSKILQGTSEILVYGTAVRLK